MINFLVRALEDTFDEQLGTTPPDIAVLKNQFQRIRHTSSSDSDGIPSSPTKLGLYNQLQNDSNDYYYRF